MRLTNASAVDQCSELRGLSQNCTVLYLVVRDPTKKQKRNDDFAESHVFLMTLFQMSERTSEVREQPSFSLSLSVIVSRLDFYTTVFS